SGGPGVLTADAADAAGLETALPSPDLRDRLEAKLPDFYALTNPFDLTVQGTEDEYRDTLIETLTEYDAAIAINVNTPYLDVVPLARGVVAASKKTGKPVVASFVAGEPAAAALPILAEGNVPNYVTGERCARVLALMAEREQSVAMQDKNSIAKQLQATAQQLPWDRRPTEPEVMDWLELLSVPIISRVMAHSADEAVQAARSFDQPGALGRPVAMKIVSPQIMHKTDVGGVILNLKTPDEIESAFGKMRNLVSSEEFTGVLITPMVDQPVEVIVGLSRDRQFGPVIAVGLGGIYTEIFNDLVLRVAPVSKDEARHMIEALKGIEILKGARGSTLRDIPALAQLVSDVSWLPFRSHGIEELDLNPVFLFEHGCVAGDARLISTRGSTHQRSD
ncbi:acetate--CoA ligase family protein, partial [Candidatus Bipolaricaulota bacterium]|nr:acetate--CoA ligase family protein [Candidatus Bipolaricaulota bacterium]